ncbi:MAG: 50S ribosome-binding GTPase [Candidatus Heimdallarchaeota archaeon]
MVDKLESKVIVLGLSQSGKTSIRQVVFEGFTPESTELNPATVRINRKLFNLAGGGINLFDIGGQTNYLNEIFQQYKERTFTDVRAVIFVVDVSDAANIMRSKYYFDLTFKSLKEVSSAARIYVFVHKMDIVPLNKREAMIKSINDIFELEKYQNASIYGTSIFDQTVWDAMQQVLSFVYPRDDAKTTEIKSIKGSHKLSFIALSTAQGLVLYSEPEVVSGVNYSRLKNELAKAYFPGMLLNQAIFTYGKHGVFMKEVEDDLIVTTIFPEDTSFAVAQESFDRLCGQISNLFQPDELLGQAKAKMRETLANYLKSNKVKKVGNLEIKFKTKIGVKCDVCGKQIQKSVLDVALENSEQIDRGIKVTAGFGTTTIKIYPVHECIEGIREIPVILDANLEYRRYEKSRPV